MIPDFGAIAEALKKGEVNDKDSVGSRQIEIMRAHGDAKERRGAEADERVSCHVDNAGEAVNSCASAVKRGREAGRHRTGRICAQAVVGHGAPGTLSEVEIPQI